MIRVLRILSAGLMAYLASFTPSLSAEPGTAATAQSGPEPGSPTATITIDGKQLPAPTARFGGVIKDNAYQSKPYWPPTVVPPKGAPNVLLVMTDDVGFG